MPAGFVESMVLQPSKSWSAPAIASRKRPAVLSRELPARRCSLAVLSFILAVLLWPPGALAEPLVPEAWAGEGSESLTLMTEPSPVVLGESGEVLLIVETSKISAVRPLQASVNVGSLGQFKEVEPGTYHARYEPPKARFPQVAIIALWRETGPEAEIAFFRVPLFGTARVPVRTRPGASVTVTVKERSFGPFGASRSGLAEARLVVPPGVMQGVVRAVTDDGEATSQRLDLGVPPYNRLTLAVVPHSVVADGSNPVRLHLYYDHEGADLPRASDFVIEASVGAVGPPFHDKGSLFQSYYIPPRGTSATDIVFEARVKGDSASFMQAGIEVGRPVPSLVRLDPVRQETIGDGSTVAEIDVMVGDDAGLGASALDLDVYFEPNEAIVSHDIQEQGRGEYLLRLVPKRLDLDVPGFEVTVGVGAGDASAEAILEVLPWRVEAVAFEPEAAGLLADGQSEITFAVRAYDGLGRPLTGFELKAEASMGTIVWAGLDEDGVGSIVYRAPLWEHRLDAVLEDVPVREDHLWVEIGEEHGSGTVHLSPKLRHPRRVRGFMEISVGCLLDEWEPSDPFAAVHLMAHLMYTGRFALSAGVWTGVLPVDQGLVLQEVGDSHGLGLPLMFAVSTETTLGAWSAGTGIGAGLMFASGSAPEMEATLDPVVRVFGGRVFVGRRVGPGRVTGGAAYLEGSQQAWSDGVHDTVEVGGLAVTLGYVVNL